MPDLRVILGGLVGLALAGLVAFGLEPPAAPIVFSQEAPTSPTPTLAITATAQPSLTPSAVPTATAIAATATTTASPPPSVTPSPLPTTKAPTAESPAPTATSSPRPTAVQVSMSNRIETPAAPTRPVQRAPLRPAVPAKIPGISIAADIPYVVRPGAISGRPAWMCISRPRQPGCLC